MNPKFAPFCTSFLSFLNLHTLLPFHPTLWLYVEVPMATLSPSKVTVKEGENVELSCTTSGVPSPELIWNMVLVSNYEVSPRPNSLTQVQLCYRC